MRQIFEGQQVIDALIERNQQLEDALRRTHAALRCEDNTRVASSLAAHWPELDQEVYELLYGNGLPSQQVLATLLCEARVEIDEAWAPAPRCFVACPAR